jgi:uncharacterized membrane protein
MYVGTPYAFSIKLLYYLSKKEIKPRFGAINLRDAYMHVQTYICIFVGIYIYAYCAKVTQMF